MPEATSAAGDGATDCVSNKPVVHSSISAETCAGISAASSARLLAPHSTVCCPIIAYFFSLVIICFVCMYWFLFTDTPQLWLSLFACLGN